MIELNGTEIYHLVRPLFQPAIGAFHGWFATRMVVVMLFRPHKTYYFPGSQRKIPFTPGIFPSRKSALAQNIAKTVTETLLTPEDIHSKTDVFLTEKNIFVGVSATVDTMLDGFRYTDNLQKLAGGIKQVIPELINTAANKFIDRLIEDQNRQLTRLTEYFVQDVLLNVRIGEKDAENIVNYIFNNFFSSENIRQTLMEVLTSERAINLQIVLKDRTTGGFKFLLSFVNIEKLFFNFREYLKNEPEKSESLIEEFIQQLKIKEDLVKKITSVDLKKLSFEDIQALKESISKTIREFLLLHRDKLNKSLVHVEDSISEIINSYVVNFNPAKLNSELIISLKKEISAFLYGYLKSELGNLIKRAIKALKPREMIESKIEGYSSQEVENLILGIMKKELANLEFLGFIIGLLLGFSALAIEYFLPLR